MNRRKYIIIAASACAGLLLVCAIVFATMLFSSAYDGEEKVYVYLREGDDVKTKLEEAGIRTRFFSLLEKRGFRLRPGRYAIEKGDDILTIFRRLRNGQQEPVLLTVPNSRTMNRLAGALSKNLMLDSATIANNLADSAFTSKYGYTPQTIPALFIADTYEVFWSISLESFMERMQKENKRFWTAERESKAKEMGFSHVEVMTLASIVDEETANNGEKPMVAGLYVKRLQIDMKLQADPTVKFAVGDFALRRILNEHLKVESPYNTYLYKGLPPGPIRIPSVAGIDAVLNYVHHDNIYMCAKEDFSGTHNFAKTYSEHLANARRYVKALNERGIK